MVVSSNFKEIIKEKNRDFVEKKERRGGGFAS